MAPAAAAALPPGSGSASAGDNHHCHAAAPSSGLADRPQRSSSHRPSAPSHSRSHSRSYSQSQSPSRTQDDNDSSRPSRHHPSRSYSARSASSRVPPVPPLPPDAYSLPVLGATGGAATTNNNTVTVTVTAASGGVSSTVPRPRPGATTAAPLAASSPTPASASNSNSSHHHDHDQHHHRQSSLRNHHRRDSSQHQQQQHRSRQQPGNLISQIDQSASQQLPPRSHSQSSPRHRHSRSSSATVAPPSRPVQEILPHNDYETSHLAQSYSKQVSSRDQQPGQSTPARGLDSSRSHRPSNSRSQAYLEQQPHRSTTNGHGRGPKYPDMAPTAVADHASPHTKGQASAHHGHAEAPNMSSPTKQSRSRTTIPTQSGKWILGKTIGAGSMGKVKLARKEDGSEQVACKIIPRGSTDDGHQSRADKERADQSKEIRTAREAAIVTLLNHPHICGLRDVVRTNYHWYMLFEFVNGGQMLDYIISHGKLKEKQARKFSRQIGSALDYCHRNSIVHRDLKIENILISKTGDIKIIDFGLSNLFSPRGNLKTFCGSLYFAAPELLQARAYTGPEVDVWSFGIVLYVLVCGKVPFDDQSMPALHAKIKKGLVDYPSWLSSECKQLMSRMLVTDPKQRASMQEVLAHPWMNKGFNGPPDNYVPAREPLSPPLDPEVIHAMQGFNFGSPESIKAQMTRIIESEEYQRAVKLYQREKELPPPTKDGEKKRGFGFDFYKRRNSGTSRDTLTGPSSEALQLGNDPLNAFHPILSIYYLVKEKQDRDRADMVPPPTAVSREKREEKEKERDRDRERKEERERRRDRSRDRHHRHHHDEKDGDAVPELPPPPAAAVTNSAAFEMPGEQPTGGRSRPRARTHGEDDAPDSAKSTPAPPPEPKQEVRKEGTAAGLLRRFSTRKRREPERAERDRSHPPVVQVHSPAGSATLAPRKSFSMRRGRPDREDGEREPRLRSGSSQPQHGELLSPPRSAGGNKESRRSGGLGRSTSVNSADIRRRDSRRLAKDPPATSGSDQSVVNEPPQPAQRGHGHSKSVSMRTKSLGHARRESIQQRRLRREALHEANVPEETDAEQEQSGVSTERLDSSDLAKPVFLKGLFSVSTTSGKSVPAIRGDIRRVLRQLNVDFTEIKGGFNCRHAPSIDLNKVQDGPASPSATPGHRRRFSFGGLMRGDDREREDLSTLDRPPTTPRTPGRSDRDRSDRDRSDRDRSYSNSEASVDSIPRRNGGSSRHAPGETSTQVQSDLGGSMVLEFEIFIVKVPLLSLHGIQFKRLLGNTWQYKSMADQILKELRL